MKKIIKKMMLWSLTAVLSVPLTVLVGFATAAKTEAADSTHLVIAQVAAGITGSTNEFVEIYNPTANSINLKSAGYKLELVNSSNIKSQKDITWVNQVIPANGYFLFAAGNVGITADATYADQLTNNSGVILADSSDFAVDSVAWGSPTGAISAVEGSAVSHLLATNESLVRKSGLLSGVGNGLDTDNNTNDFEVSVLPKPLNSSSPQAVVVGLTLSGLPGLMSNSTTTDIRVSGTNIANYQYSIDGGAPSQTFPVSQHIVLTNLSNGLHVIAVLGQYANGNWQTQVEQAGAYSWIIDSSAPVITLKGQPVQYIDQYSPYDEVGATALDNFEGDMSSKIVVTGTVDSKTPNDYFLHYNLTDSFGNAAVEVTRTVVVVPAIISAQTLPDQTVTIQPGASQGTVINIAKDLTGEILDLSKLNTSVVDQTKTVTTEHQINVNLATAAGQIEVAIPGGTKISGSDSWDGKLSLPEIVANPTLSTLAAGDFVVSDGTTVRIGLGSAGLTFDQPVQIIFTGNGTKKVGFIDNTGKFTEIATTCDSATAPTNIPTKGECKIATNDGADLTVWTEHFTSFVTYSAEQVLPPVFSVTAVDKSGSHYIDVAWTGTATGVDYEIRINNSFVKTVVANSDPVGKTYSYEFGPFGSGDYAVAVYSIKGVVKSNSVAKTVVFSAPTPAPVAAGNKVSSTPAVSLVSKASAAAVTPVAPATQSTVSTPTDSQGVIKGTESAAETTETTNWTPWIILFTLIILAGAVTGGYFYWFSGKEEIEKPAKETSKVSGAKVVVREKKAVKSSKQKPAKKQNRW